MSKTMNAIAVLRGSVKARSHRHRETRNEERETRNEKREIGRSGHTATEKRETRNGSVDQ